MSETVVPHSFSEAAATLATAAAQERPVRVIGGGTKLDWGAGAPPGSLRLLTTHLSRLTLHDDGLTATINAGTSLARAQVLLSRSGLMLAADPHLGPGRQGAATVGGVVATADTGPLSHRYGPVRDQIVGVTVALSDGTIVRAGPRGQQSQDGYDLTRLMVGSYGTLGAILALDVRVRLLPTETATAIGVTGDPVRLHEAAGVIGRGHRDLEAFDVAWHGGRGGLLAQVAGDDARARAAAVSDTMRRCGLEGVSVRADDAGLWARQRAGQRSTERAVLRIHAGAGDLDTLVRLADQVDAILVGRAALGIAYLTLDVTRIASVRAALPRGATAIVLDLPAPARGAVDPWGLGAGPELELMRGLKRRFDPAGVCNPGIYVGRI